MPLHLTHPEPGAAVFELHTYEEAVDAAYDAVARGQKALVCTNRIKTAEELYRALYATGVAVFTTCPHAYHWDAASGGGFASSGAGRAAIQNDRPCVVVIPDQGRPGEVAPAGTLLIHAELPAYRYRQKFEAAMQARAARIAGHAQA
jgi:hypothetical protein